MIPVDFALEMRQYDARRERCKDALARCAKLAIVAAAVVYVLWVNL